MRPAALTTSTSSGSGLFQREAGWMPTSAPCPTADIGCDLVKISASGPIPTSRYCDQAPWATRCSLSRVAASEPGRTARRSAPTTLSIRAPDRRRPAGIALAPAPRPRARACCAAKVTPAALSACRSTGASSQGCAGIAAVPAAVGEDRRKLAQIRAPRASGPVPPGRRRCRARSWSGPAASGRTRRRHGSPPLPARPDRPAARPGRPGRPLQPSSGRVAATLQIFVHRHPPLPVSGRRKR